MKRELNMELLQDIAFKSIGGITVKEIIELRQTYQLDEYEYFNRIKLRYIVHLGLLGFEYKITHEVERILSSYINHLIHELPVDGLDSDNEFHLSVS